MSQKTHTLLIDSRDRVNPLTSNTNDCRLYVKPAIKDFTKVELLSFSMPVTQYNVDSTNNQIYFDVGGSDYTASITEGSYTICTITAELKRVMDLASSENFDIWYDEALFRLVFTIGTGTFSFTWGTNTSNTAAGLLGFLNSDSTPAQTITSDHAINLSLPLYFYVDIPQFGIHCRSTNENDYATFVVSSLQNSAGINVFNMFSNYQLLERSGNTTLNAIDVRIKERGNKLVDLQNSEWAMLLRFWYPENPSGDGI